MKSFYVYILASKQNGTLYTGFSSDLPGRTWKHKEVVTGGFTERYGVKRLVYYEVYDDPETAIKREKQLKRWRRRWKLELIEKENPLWKDLFEEVCS